MKLSHSAQPSGSHHLFESNSLSLLKPRFAFESDNGTEATGAAPIPPNKPEPTIEPVAVATPDEPLGEAGKRALEVERVARKEAEKRLKQFEGVDPGKYKELLTLQQQQALQEQERQQKELEKQQRYEEALKLKDESFGREKQSYQEQLKTLESQLKQQAQLIAQKEILREFTIAFGANDGYTEDAKTLLKDDLIQPFLKYDAEADAVVAINPETGDRLTNGKNDFLSLKEWVATWKPQKPRHFRPENTNSGGGTNPTKPRAIGSGEPVTDISKVKFEDLMNRARSKAK